VAFELRKFVTRHGRRIEVETMPDPPEVVAKIRERKQKAERAFAKLGLAWAISVAAELPEFLVFYDLRRRAWEARGQGFVLPSGWLKRYGVSRRVKDRVLRGLEVTGKIAVERSPGKSPRVTPIDL
jgi:hypothetical protein